WWTGAVLGTYPPNASGTQGERLVRHRFDRVLVTDRAVAAPQHGLPADVRARADRHSGRDMTDEIRCHEIHRVAHRAALVPLVERAHHRQRGVRDVWAAGHADLP